jgi:predicted dehydrogenase
MVHDEGTTRRQFLKSSAAVAAGMALAPRALGAPGVLRARGANDRIRVGFIGVGNRGSQLLGGFMQNDDVEVAALCDVYEPYTHRDRSKVHPRILDEISQVPRMEETFPNEVGRYNDFRRVLERDDIDAVCIATPDHWHAIQTIQALDAGKDVYVEKPLTITIHEGRKMVEAAERTNRVVQVGLNRRGSSVYRQLAREVPEGKIGKVTVARAYRINNMYPGGIGNSGPSNPPDGFDWDLWLGPRAYRPYQDNLALYKFRWWKDYSSQMGNWGVHYLDVIRWLMGEQAPVAISAHGGKFALTDDRTIPDTMEVTFEFASGAIAVFGIYEATGGAGIEGGEVEFRGTKGNLLTGEGGYRVVPSGAGQFQQRSALVEPEEVRLEQREDSTGVLIRDFLDCVKSRNTPLCPLEEGHRSTSFAHLANIALETGTRLQWDPAAERFTNHDAANRLLHYEYRKPWTLG